MIEPGIPGRRSIARATLRAAAGAVAAVVILAPLSSLVIWSFTRKWFWPHPFPQEWGLFYWQKVLEGDLPGARAMLARLDAACTYGCAEAEELRLWIDHGGDPAS